jgi:hypothetical protein
MIQRRIADRKKRMAKNRNGSISGKPSLEVIWPELQRKTKIRETARIVTVDGPPPLLMAVI